MLQIALFYVKLHISHRETALNFLRLECCDCVEQIEGMEGLCSNCCSQSAAGYLGGMLLCKSCMALYFSPTLPISSDQSTQSGVRFCRRCNAQVSNSEVTCRSCGYTDLDLVSVESVSMPTQPQLQLSTLSSAPTNPYWTCSNCGYKYNVQTNCNQCRCVKDGQQKSPTYQEAPAVMPSAGMISQTAPNGACWACGNCQYAYNLEANCLKCRSLGPPSYQKSNRQSGLGTSSSVRSQQPEVLTYSPQVSSSLSQQSSDYHQAYAEALVPPVSNPTPGYWTCATCGYAYNQGDMTTCAQLMCGKPKPIPEGNTQAETWMCPNCSQENPQHAELCIKCKVKRGWENYLEYKGMELNYNKTMWKCKKCRHFVNISENQCGNCGRIPKKIEKGLKGEGYKTSLKERFKHWTS